MRCGVGQVMAPAVPCSAPDAVTLRLAGSPASPGFSQYVCQPGRSCRRRATCRGVLALAVLASVIRLAVLWGLTSGALSAAIAPWSGTAAQAMAAASRHASPRLPGRRGPRGRARQRRVGGCWPVGLGGREAERAGRRINVSFQHGAGLKAAAYAKPAYEGNGSCGPYQF